MYFQSQPKKGRANQIEEEDKESESTPQFRIRQPVEVGRVEIILHNVFPITA